MSRIGKSRDRKQIGDCQGLGEEGMGSNSLMCMVFLFGDDENILEILSWLHNAVNVLYVTNGKFSLFF